MSIRSYVVDASVGIKLCVSDALSDAADALVAMAAADAPWVLHVPDLFYVADQVAAPLVTADENCSTSWRTRRMTSAGSAISTLHRL